MKDDTVRIKGDVKHMYGFKKHKTEWMHICTDQYVKYNKDKMLDNFHKIISQDCYGCQRRWKNDCENRSL